MDIEGNLFYNENTVHSGDFLENLTGFGKETMRGKIRTYQTERKEGNRTDARRIVRHTMRVFALFMCSILCGCTRKEQLVLEMDGATQAAQYEAPDVQDREVSELKASETSESQADKTAAGGVAEDSGAMPKTQEQMQPDQASSTMYVHVCGAVKNPGVYELDIGSRVYEAIEEAGGFTEDADESYVNQAQRLKDGAKLIIPTMEQTKSMFVSDFGGMIGIIDAEETEQAGSGQEDSAGVGVVSNGNAVSDDKININTASEAELCNIPGIGATRAAAIVAYRQEKSGFTSIEDIMNVSGIKEGTYDKIKDRIKVN